MKKSPENHRKILATCALLYANGPLHLGHLVEYLQADIWVRTQRLLGHECHFVCGNDAHGTPIMLKARENGISPEALITQIHEEHEADFNDFLVSFDNFYTTHSPENKKHTENIFQALEKKGDITAKTIVQAFDPKEKIFLPDRFIYGECPRCNSADQYGDNCEVCGASYSPAELINPTSSISGATPIKKETEHLFFNLENYHDLLNQYVCEKHLQKPIANKLKEWLDGELKAWDISRDEPYFGFEIPNHPGKYFYVWLDAPIGYMASFDHYCQQQPQMNFDEYWHKDSKTELWHFIGKDIVYFHALFWPAMLKGADFRLPSRVQVHGYLTVNGQKMSKSRGTFITARDYLKHFEPEYLRYYFAAKLNNDVVDLDLNLEDFATRVNADLVGKYVNLASRCAGFITKHFDGKLSDALDDSQRYETCFAAQKTITDYLTNLEYNKAIREIMSLADSANQYIDQEKPWTLAKEDKTNPKIQAVCTQGLNLFRIITAYLKPILPKTAKAVEHFLNCDSLDFNNIETPLLAHQINPFKPLMQRITKEKLDEFIEHHGSA